MYDLIQYKFIRKVGLISKKVHQLNNFIIQFTSGYQILSNLIHWVKSIFFYIYSNPFSHLCGVNIRQGSIFRWDHIFVNKYVKTNISAIFGAFLKGYFIGIGIDILTFKYGNEKKLNRHFKQDL